MLIVGEISYKNKNILEGFIDECKKEGIEVLTLKKILDELKPNLLTHTYLNPIIKTVQMVDLFK